MEQNLKLNLSNQTRSLMLVNEAQRWVGVQEIGGNNRGQLVEIFQRSQGLSPGDPWCLAFVQYCISQVDRMCHLLDPLAPLRKISAGNHCVTLWNTTPIMIKSKDPVVGSVVLWHLQGGSSGHAGIVISADADGQSFRTIEGNTSPSQGVNRDGDGVFQKSHTLKPFGKFELLGFILPWGAETV